MTMERYYADRAQEYEAVYHRSDPIRQKEQQELADAIQGAMKGRRVLELACGTGYWTERAAATASHIVAVDAAEETLEIARSKALSPEKVEFHKGDAYALGSLGRDFDAGLATFWFSHVPKARIGEFLSGFHGALQEGSPVFMADNMLVEGLGGDLIREDGAADTSKRRTLSDGSTHIILKNYYDAEELRSILSPHVEDLIITMRTHFWWVQYLTKKRNSIPHSA